MLPIALNVSSRPVLIVGGGGVAARKARMFLNAGARVTVISPILQEGFPPVAHIAGYYSSGDVDGFSLVCACTDSREANTQVEKEAKAAGIWCNIADDPERSDFHTAALVIRGEISIAISTSGSSPVLSRHLKGKIENSVGPEYAELLEIANSYRIETKKRGDFWRRLLESEILPLLKSGKRDEAVALFESLFESLLP